MSMLSCPKCDLLLPVALGERETEFCPRCLARSTGALSVSLEPVREEREHHGLGILARMFGDSRHAVASSS